MGASPRSGCPPGRGPSVAHGCECPTGNGVGCPGVSLPCAWRWSCGWPIRWRALRAARPGLIGRDTCHGLRAAHSTTPVIISTCHADGDPVAPTPGWTPQRVARSTPPARCWWVTITARAQKNPPEGGFLRWSDRQDLNLRLPRPKRGALAKLSYGPLCGAECCKRRTVVQPLPGVVRWERNGMSPTHARTTDPCASVVMGTARIVREKPYKAED